MKKIAFTLSLIMCILLAASCGSFKTSKGTVTDDTFKTIYSRYSSDLIMEGTRSYTVVAGDTLHHIAANYYPDGYYYPVILLASRDVLVDPHKIQVGMVLTVPDLEANLSTPSSRAAVKGVIYDCSNIERSRDWIDGANALREIADSL